MNWYAVQTQPNRENLAVSHLKRQGFDVWLPLIERIIRHARQTKRVRRPLFPGYLFIEADLEHQDLSVIRSTLGCIAFLRHGVRPALVPNQVMASIKEAEDVLHGRFEINQGFTRGSKYELMEQGFNGHTATFLALDGKDRARVLVTLLNSEHEVKIPTSSLGQQLS